jgi:protein-S-isoprenylcysteine O-methyltransferase Ste14
VIDLLSLFYITKFCGLFCLACFVWGAIFHFKHVKEVHVRKYIFSLSASIATIINTNYLITENRLSKGQLSGSLLLYLLSLFIFISAVRVTRKRLAFVFSKISTNTLILAGPYRIIRHPFYSSYILCWLACVIFRPNILTVAVLIWMTYLYYSAAKLEEQSILEGPLKKPYQEYRSSVGMFIPFLV